MYVNTYFRRCNSGLIRVLVNTGTCMYVHVIRIHILEDVIQD